MANTLAASPPKHHILCIDDYESGLAVRRKLLEAWGYSVTTALTPNEGLAVLRQSRVDAVILDYEMHGFDGEQIARVVKTSWPDVPILMYSGYPNIPASVKGSVDALLQKGGDTEQLRSTLATLLICVPRQMPRQSAMHPVRRAHDTERRRFMRANLGLR